MSNTTSSNPRVLVLITDGINCNIETARAFELAGAECEEVHLNEILSGKRKISEFDIISFPGGFSYGDDVKSGKIFSLNLMKIKDDLAQFLKDGKLMLGICNGFQVLTTFGISPYNILGTPDVSLYWNNSAKYECRWVNIKVPAKVNSPWLTGMQGKTLKIQAAHAEGRLLTNTDKEYDDLFEKELIAFQYVDNKGNVTEEYPQNPNGSKQGVAGLVDVTGQVLGMMPHPERNVEAYHHPDFRNLPENHIPDGLLIFKNAVEYIRNR